MEPFILPTVYLTREQIARLAGLTCDALVGAQITTDAGDQSEVLIDMVHVDDPSGTTRHYAIDPDGSFKETT